MGGIPKYMLLPTWSPALSTNAEMYYRNRLGRRLVIGLFGIEVVELSPPKARSARSEVLHMRISSRKTLLFKYRPHRTSRPHGCQGFTSYQTGNTPWISPVIRKKLSVSVRVEAVIKRSKFKHATSKMICEKLNTKKKIVWTKVDG